MIAKPHAILLKHIKRLNWGKRLQLYDQLNFPHFFCVFGYYFAARLSEYFKNFIAKPLVNKQNIEIRDFLSFKN